MVSSRTAWPTPKSVELRNRTRRCTTAADARAHAQRSRNVGVFYSVQAQPPRQSECCAGLGRNRLTGSLLVPDRKYTRDQGNCEQVCNPNRSDERNAFSAAKIADVSLLTLTWSLTTSPLSGLIAVARLIQGI